MASSATRILICACEGTMAPDRAAVERALPGAEITTARHACGLDLVRFRDAAASPGRTLVACTAMAHLFRDVAEGEGLAADLVFANIRETGGWSAEGDHSGPKTAALLAAALEEVPPAPIVTYESGGVALILGRDEVALDAARRLADRLDVTVLLAERHTAVPMGHAEWPVATGRVAAARGHLGAFELTIDGFSEAAPSSRGAFRFGPRRDGAVSQADIVVDLSGGAPLFPAPELRPGYLRADPGDRAAVAGVLLEASGLVGTFDKPRYVAFSESLCAHSRSRKVGCRRCLDLCPTGAITPAGDHVAIDPHVCAGCGACAAACPTGAVSYALPEADALMRRLRAMMQAYRAAGGTEAVILFHDGEHGTPLIDASARYGAGLPARVIPVAVEAVTQVGPEAIAALFAYGAAAVRLLVRARPRHDVSGLHATIDLMDRVLSGLGYGAGLVRLIGTDDPDGLEAALADIPGATPLAAPATFLPRGPKRAVLDFALSELHRVAPAPVDVLPLPEGAPFGRVAVDTDGCTLCLACVSVCPTSALADAAEKPLLSFDESLCVQCGLCAATCPEKVVTLDPRIAFLRPSPLRQTIKEEEPFCCIACGKPFGTRSSIERVVARLADRHWMFSGPAARSRLDLVRMCDDCRVVAVTADPIDPYAASARPVPRTSEDYRRDEAGAGPGKR